MQKKLLWTARPSRAFRVMKLEFTSELRKKTLMFLLTFAIPLGVVIMTNFIDNKKAEDFFFSGLVFSQTVRLLNIVFSKRSIDKDRVLYVQYNRLEVTLGKLMNEIFLYAVVIFINTGLYIMLSIPFGTTYLWIFSWGWSVVFGAISIFALYVIMIKLLISIAPTGLFFGKVFPIIFALFLYMNANLFDVMVEAATSQKDSAPFMNDNVTVIALLPILNTILFTKFSELDDKIWTIFIMLYNILIFVVISVFVLSPLEKKGGANVA